MVSALGDASGQPRPAAPAAVAGADPADCLQGRPLRSLLKKNSGLAAGENRAVRNEGEKQKSPSRVFPFHISTI